MRYVLMLVLVLLAPISWAGANQPLELINSYIDGLNSLERLRIQMGAKVNEPVQHTALLACVHSGKLIQSEYQQQGDRFGSMHLNAIKELQWVPKSIADSDRRQADLYGQLVEECSSILASSSDPSTNEQRLAHLAQVQALIEAGERRFSSQIQMAIFMTLVDDRGDGRERGSHLVITKAEKQKLLDKIQSDFGPSIDSDQKSVYVFRAWFVRQALAIKGYRCADES